MCSLVGVRGDVAALVPDTLVVAGLASVRVAASPLSSSFRGRPGEQGCGEGKKGGKVTPRPRG